MKIARLEARIAEVEEIINRLQGGNKRQAAPFSRGLPKVDPRRPGRKSGDGYGTPPVCRAMPEPSPVDQVIDVPPPVACPSCGSVQAVEDHVDQQVQRDIEMRTVVRRFVIPIGNCLPSYIRFAKNFGRRAILTEVIACVGHGWPRVQSLRTVQAESPVSSLTESASQA